MMNANVARTAQTTRLDREYVPGYTLEAYQEYMSTFPRFRDVIAPDFADLDEVMRVAADGNEFDDDVSGRGDTYRVAQRHCSVRITGIRTLVEAAVGPVPPAMPSTIRVLDVLGGDGTMARAVAALWPGYRADPWIMTGDLSRNMVAGAIRYGLPAVCQPAQRMMLRDGTFDAVVLAYGTHHIPVPERQTAYAEAWRVLKPGGRIVVHDFEGGSPVARWFAEVVHRYAPNGHDYSHFTRADLARDLSSVGFTSIDVGDIYDPFIVHAATPAEATDQLVTYASGMYGLFRLTAQAGWRSHLRELMQQHMTYPPGSCPVTEVCTARSATGWTATMPRVALVGIGQKPR